MIKLNKVEFYGFQDTTKNVVLEFTRNNNVTIIFGENGCGKTTFLKLLNATFKRDSKILSENNIDKINIYYQVGDKTDKKISICRINMDERISKILKADKLLNKYSDRFSNDEKKKLLQAIFSQQKIENSFNEDEYDWEDFSKSELQESKSLTLGIDRGSNYSFSRTFTTLDLKNFILRHRKFRTIFEKLDINEFSEDFSLYIKNRNSLNKSLEDFDFENNHIYLPKIELNKITNLLLNKYRVAKAETTSRIQNALFKTLSNVIDDKLEGNESNGINQDSCNLEARLDARYKERIIDSLSEIADNPLKNKVIELLQNENKAKDNKILQILIYNMAMELKREEESLTSINAFINGFNRHLSGNKELKLELEKMYVLINKKKYDLEILSSGEKHIFTLLALVNLLGNSKDFLIVDEPEISLNVTWKRNLLSLLTKILPNTQIIVASHSPSIAANFNDSLQKIEELA